MRGWPLLVVIVGCTRAVSPVAPADQPWVTPRRAPVGPPEVATLGLVGPVEDLWPIGHAPALEPHLPIAEAFGVGVAWTELCERRPDPVYVVDRDAVLDYTLAWCALRRDDIRHGVGGLAALFDTTAYRVREAVRADLVEVGALTGEVRDAGLDPDRLTAAYLSVGRLDDAQRVMRELVDARSTHEARCHRLVRAYVLATEDRNQLETEIRHAASDPVCADAAPMFDCPVAYGMWQPQPGDVPEACAPLERAHPIVAARIHLARVHVRWRQAMDTRAWIRFALDEAKQPYALPGVEETAVRALENAMIFADCQQDASAIREAAAAVFAHPDRDGELEGWLGKLRRLDVAGCRDQQLVKR